MRYKILVMWLLSNHQQELELMIQTKTGAGYEAGVKRYGAGLG